MAATRTKKEPRTTDATRTKKEPRSADATRTKNEPRTAAPTRTKNEPRTTDATRTKNKPRTTIAANRTKNEPRTAERILDIAEGLVQSRGFGNFSYADIATELGITKASLHYHYPGKAELGYALITRYAERFSQALADIDRDLPEARAKLEAYADLYAGVLRNERMCMCGILAAEYLTLPDPMRNAVLDFFDENQKWLARMLKQGKADGTLSFRGRAEDVAQGILSTLEGAMLVARPYGNLSRFDAAVKQLVAGLTRK